MKRLPIILLLAWCWTALAAEVIPPAPARYFNDYAGVTQPATADRLNRTLEDFEKQTSSQIVVVVYPKMQTDSSIEDYTVRVFRAWGVGQKDKNNGAVLFVFVQDRKTWITTGYGLEAALPDALCKQIQDDEITPRFKQGDYDGGLSAGVTAMIAAAKGEYKGTGRTVAEGGSSSHTNLLGGLIPIIVFIAFLIFAVSRGRGLASSAGWIIGSGLGGGWSGGGGFGGGFGGGGGFSGGGGSTGGGGAGGSW